MADVKKIVVTGRVEKLAGAPTNKYEAKHVSTYEAEVEMGKFDRPPPPEGVMSHVAPPPDGEDAMVLALTTKIRVRQGTNAPRPGQRMKVTVEFLEGE